jgi:hypothetical protein
MLTLVAPPPALAYQTAHSNLLVVKHHIRSLLDIAVILQSEEQGCDPFITADTYNLITLEQVTHSNFSCD